ncbi:MAG: S41 family peptidase [Bacteroidaceae bacterium]|nr:S41 family peptidase [Bacteroidaceae bacterium]
MKRSRITVIIVFLLSALITWAATKQQDLRFQASKSSDIFHSILRDLSMLYVDTINLEDAVNKGIDAMLSSLDPYTEFYSEQEETDLKMMTTGKYAGIGAIIRQYPEKNLIAIEEPYEGMPAARYGLKAGDLILRIDGEDMRGKTNAEVSDKLRGEPDTKLVVTVSRPGVSDSLDVELVRSVIALPAVPYFGMTAGKYGYIILESFTDGCSKDVRKAIEELLSQGAEGLILDLRGNGGGLMTEAIDIVGLFVPKGTKVVETKGRAPQSSRTYSTGRAPVVPELPLVVMVDEQSASASEIVSGALQDLDRAVIVGNRTFGKGLVQSTRPLPYNGTLKLTTSKYYIPSGRCIQKVDYAARRNGTDSKQGADTISDKFYTASRRPVKADGGIYPDSVCKLDTMPDILYRLTTDVVLFDFVNKYCIENKQIAPMEEFEVTDALFDEFVDYVHKSDFKFESNSSKALDLLKDMAKLEGLADKAADEFKALEQKLQYDMNKDLEVFREDLKRLLAVEIATRYYYQRGGIYHSLKDDNCLSIATYMLDNQDVYNKILKVVKD